MGLFEKYGTHNIKLHGQGGGLVIVKSLWDFWRWKFEDIGSILNGLLGTNGI
jgi:hypothetical protein